MAGGQAGNCTAGALLLERLPASRNVLADEGYDSGGIQQQIEAASAQRSIPPKINRRCKPSILLKHYRGRNAVERMLVRIKDFHRTDTRYDRLASSYLAANYLAATIIYGYK